MVLSYEICEVFQNRFSIEHLRTSASRYINQALPWIFIFVVLEELPTVDLHYIFSDKFLQFSPFLWNLQGAKLHSEPSQTYKDWLLYENSKRSLEPLLFPPKTPS